MSCGSSMESLLSSAEHSPAGSKSGSPISSPVTARRIIREAADHSQSPQSLSLVAARTTKLNFFEERLKEEFSGSSRLLFLLAANFHHPSSCIFISINTTINY